MKSAEQVAPAATALPLARRTRWAWTLATFFGVGRLRPAPGTWASAATVGLWWAGARTAPASWRIPLACGLGAAVALAGIRPAGIVEGESGKIDPGFVVLDEVAGQFLALAGAPLAWKSLIASFILFRGFDITKPPPLRRLEKIPGGAGIMLDDVGAGLYALVVLQLLLRFGLLG